MLSNKKKNIIFFNRYITKGHNSENMNIGYLKIELDLYFIYLKLVFNFQVNQMTKT